MFVQANTSPSAAYKPIVFDKDEQSPFNVPLLVGVLLRLILAYVTLLSWSDSLNQKLTAR